MISITGTWIKGFGTAGTFLSHPSYIKQFKEKLGFIPFPGTLNLEVKKEKLEELKATAENVYMHGFKENRQEYFGVNCFPCKINGLTAAIVVPDKTTHPENIMEVIANEELVKKFSLQVGDTLIVEVE
ncbi:MAG: DUF120 domain-containing protein [Candidatus Diapherotrites archaeon]|nr:DUF120 domain-containing protein [Candidatus Diapherotrites archaeon]